MSTVRGAIEAVVSPVGIMTICLVLGLVLHVLLRHSRAGVRLVFAGAILGLVYLLTPLSELLYAHLEHRNVPMLTADSSARFVVVLGGYGEAMPSLPITSRLGEETLLRMTEGIRLYRDVPGARLVLSGGIVREGDGPLAALMAEYARAAGVPEQDILVEGKSTDTYENLLESRAIVGTQPFILVTSSGEMWRAAAVARRLGMKALPAPAGSWAARYFPAGMSWHELAWKGLRNSGSLLPERLEYLQRAHHEYLGYLWYWMQGRV